MAEGILIEVTEDRLNLPGYEPFAKGDRKNLPAELAKHVCGKGWATAVNGEVETGERVPGSSKPLQGDKIYQKSGVDNG